MSYISRYKNANIMPDLNISGGKLIIAGKNP